jgi:hypothetical protein
MPTQIELKKPAERTVKLKYPPHQNIITQYENRLNKHKFTQGFFTVDSEKSVWISGPRLLSFEKRELNNDATPKYKTFYYKIFFFNS